MKSSNKLSQVAKHDKHQVFSIRKFNVGVASVAIAAFWMVNGAAVATATEVAPEGDTIVQIAPAASEEAGESDEEPASQVAEESAEVATNEEVVAETVEVAQEAATESTETEKVSEETAEEAPAEEVSEETTEEAKEEAAAESKEEPKAESKSEASAEVATPVAEVQPVRVAATTYKVVYTDTETGEQVYQRNYSANEETTTPKSEGHTFNVTVATEIDTASALAGYTLADEQTLRIVNGAIEAAIVEGNAASRKLVVNVIRRDDVTATNNNTEGYTMLFAAEGDAATSTTAESVAKTNYQPTPAVEGDYVVAEENIALSKGWTTYTEEANNKEEVYESAIIQQIAVDKGTVLAYTADGQGNQKTIGDVIDVDKIVIDQDENHLTFGVFWLGQPEDGQDDAATGDYNERNNTSYYVVVSREKYSDTVYATLKDYDNPDGIETLTFTIGSNEEKTFATLDAKAAKDRDETSYAVKVGSELVNVGYLSSKKGVDPAQNYGVYLLNQLSPVWTGTGVNAGNFNIPTVVTQTNSYYLVDNATYKKWLAANEGKTGEDYVSYRDFVGNRGDSEYHADETLLAKLEQEGLNGNVFTLADALDYNKYELIESPYENQEKVNEKLVENFTIGHRSQNISGNANIKRIKQVTDTDGTVTLEVWALNPLHENGPKSWQNQVARDWDVIDPAELEEAGFTLLYKTDPIKPGEYNDKWFALDGVEKAFIADWNVWENGNLVYNVLDRAKQVPDEAIDQIRTQVEAYPGVDGWGNGQENGNGKAIGNVSDEYYSDRWAFTGAGTTGHTYGVLRVPTILPAFYNWRDADNNPTASQPVGTEPARLRVGLLSVQLNNNNFQNWQEVNYYYVEKGSVIVHYEDMNGNIIKTEVLDEDHATSGTQYDTATDNKPESITAEDGTTYYLVADVTTDRGATVVNGVKQDQLPEDGTVDNKTQTYVTDETGEVVAGTDKHVTYVYQKGGDVVVNYVINGTNTPISGTATYPAGQTGKGTVSEQEVDTKAGNPNGTYNTAGVDANDMSLRPETITTADGKIYKLVPSATEGDEEGTIGTGTIEKDTAKQITYKYELVTGGVVVNYQDKDGNPIKASVTDEPSDTPAGKTYDTTDNKPTTITTEDGRVYVIREDLTKGDGEKGEVTEGTKQVTYVYEELTSNVVVDYYAVDKNGDVHKFPAAIIPQAKDETGVPGGTDYDTFVDNAPEYIQDPSNGKIYRRLDLNTDENGNQVNKHAYTDGDAVDGKTVIEVDADGNVIKDTLTVNYYYEAPTANLVVNYYLVDKDGNELTDIENYPGLTTTAEGHVLVKQETPEEYTNVAQGTTYDADKYHDEIITLPDGRQFARYVAPWGWTRGNGTDPVGTDLGDDYKNGKLTAKLDENDQVQDTTTINYYYYQLTGDVTVDYIAVDEKGNQITFFDGQPLQPSVVDTEKGNPGDSYDTSDKHPTYITRDFTLPDGTVVTQTYKDTAQMPDIDVANTAGDPVTGTVEANTEKNIDYFYSHVTGNVLVRYYAVDENGQVIEFEDGSKLAADVYDTLERDLGQPYDTTDSVQFDDAKEYDGVNTKPDTIVKDGVTYKRVDINGDNPHKYTDGDPETGTIEELTFTDPNGNVHKRDAVINYYYEKVTGDVVIHYVDINGNVIAEDHVDTLEGNIGDSYDAAQNNDSTDGEKPEIIEAEDGTVYYLTAKTAMADGTEIVDGTRNLESIEGEGKNTVKHTANTTGEVIEGTTHITYVYEKAGHVKVNYVIEGTDEPLSGDATYPEGVTGKSTVDTSEWDTVSGKPESPYDTTDFMPTKITTADGKVYELVPESTVGDETGEVVAGETLEVTYKYREVKDNVTVEHVGIDKDGNEIVLEETTPVFSDDQSIGTDYETSKLSDEELGEGYVKTKDGRVFKFTRMADDSAPVTGDVEEGPQHVKYIYEEVIGSVTVEHKTVDGKTILIEKADVKRDVSLNETYETAPNKEDGAEQITTEDGRVYRFVKHDETSAPATGDVKEEDQHVVYLYEEVLGDVIVHYVDEAGNTIKGTVTDTPKGSVNRPYDTTDLADEYISVTVTDPETGTPVVKTYVRIPEKTQGTEKGDVVEGTTEVTYVYKEYVAPVGSVVVRYHIVDEQGNIITENVLTQVADTTNEPAGTDYDTTDYKPTELNIDGRIYDLVPTLTKGEEKGDVVANDTLVIEYHYVERTGSVTVEHVSDKGEVLIPTKDVKRNASLNETYTTSDEGTITTEDGRVFTYKKVHNDSAPTSGDVKAKDQHVIYVYTEVTGSVTVEHISDEGEVLIPTKDVKRNASLNETYTTSDEGTITTEDGRVFKFTKVADDSAAVSGDVEEGTKHVKYVYTEVTGDVVVNYVDTNGNVIKSPIVDTPDSSLTTPYDTTDNKPTYITTVDENGVTKLYRIVPTLTEGNENGEVVEGTTEITYVYEEVKPEEVGSVIVRYHIVDEDGNVIEANALTEVPDETKVVAGTTFDTTDHKPETIVIGGKVYDLVADLTTDPETGEVIANDTIYVNYYYVERTGSVTVEHITDKGEVLIPTEDVKRDASLNERYTTSDKGEITTEDGRVFRYVKLADDSAPAKGDVEAGEQHVVYVYTEVKGDVVVNYVDTKGNVIKSPIVDTPDSSLTTPYDTTDNKPTYITTVDEDGVTKLYRIVPTLTEGNENGEVVEGTTEITYVYEEVKPEEVGSVIVRYHIVDEDGNVIEANALTEVPDETEVVAGTTYDTTDHKPATITIDRKVYDLVAELTTDPETGDVIANDVIYVNYYYVERTGSVTVEHVSDKGEVLIPTADVKRDASLSETYETSDEGTITTADGRVFKFTKVADDSAEPEGNVEAGEKHVKYVYTEVTGSVTVEHVSDKGEVLIPTTDVKRDASLNDTYTTSDEGTITTADGRVFKFTKVADDSAAVSGDVEEGTKHVKYVYTEVTGSVTVEHVTDKGEVLIPTADVKRDVSLNETYTTSDEGTIVTADGRVFRFTKVADDSAAVSGDVEEGTKHVKYVYTEVKGDVIVHYVDENGNTIKRTVTDTPTSSVATPYDTTDLADEYITVIDENGQLKTYVRVPVKTIGDENGKVVEGTTEITYVYKLVEEPAEEVETGSVIVRYHIVDENGNIIVEDAQTLVKDTVNALAGTEFDTSDYRPATIVINGEIYDLVPSLTVDPETGKVIAGEEQVVNYHYVKRETAEQPTTVWVTEDGKVLRPTEDGSLPKDAFEGYEYVGTTVDEAGNITHIFKPVEAAKVTTVWVTEDGKVLRPTEDGTLPQEAFEGYEYVGTTVDEAGNTTHIFKKVATTPAVEEKATPSRTPRTRQATTATPKYVTKDTASLPNTGEQNSSVAMVGLGMMVTAMGLMARRRKED